MPNTIDAVIVTYNPNFELLARCVESLTWQVRTLYIVDNGSQSSRLSELGGVELICLESNMGIGYAQNVGLKVSLQNDPSYILLSDQDTVYPHGFVDSMLGVYADINHSNNIAALSPLFSDSNKQIHSEGFVRFSTFGFKRFSPLHGIHPIDQMIASGMIIKVELLRKIGLFNEELFIDWVDMEWCWRAKKEGYALMGNADVIIAHQLGDNVKNVGGRDVNLRSPIRHYYIVRNAMYLGLRNTSIDWKHRATLVVRAFGYVFWLSILSKPFLTHLRFTMSGFIDGVVGRMGKYHG